MNLPDLHDFLQQILAWDVEHLTALAIGIVLGCLLTWIMIARLVRRRTEGAITALRVKIKHQLDEIEAKEEALLDLRDEYEQKVNALHQQLADLLKSAHSQALELQKAQQGLSREREEVRALNQRLQSAWSEKQQVQNSQVLRERELAELRQAAAAFKGKESASAEQLAGLGSDNAKLQAIVQNLQQRLAQETEKVRQLSEQCEQMQEVLDDQSSRQAHLETAAQEQARLVQELASLRQKIQLVTDLEGKIWEQPPAADIPPFRTGRGARILAVANLKGGVGKTTLTANLGATLAKEGYRVLLVDLDYQGSLTSLCLRPEKANQLYKFSRFVRELFTAAGPLDEVAWKNVTDLDNPRKLHLLGTDELLVDEEERAKFDWLLNPGRRDIRYLFRSAFHAPLFQQAFDVILFDCPPRLTTACLNALACADHVLIPVLLDKTSADAVPRLCTWLSHLRIANVCPNVTRATVVGNEGRPYKSSWTLAQQEILERLKDPCPGSAVAVTLLEQVIPYKSKFAEAAENHTFAALDKELQPVFSNLVAELIKGKVIHESPRLATVP